jgi:hypothetical protein
MKTAGWMGAVSAFGWLAGLATFGDGASTEVLAGLAGPLAVGSASVVLTERTHRLKPARVMPLMMTALVVKLVLFGVYVAAMLNVASLRPGPFAATFTTSFIALHLIEAFRLRRLFTAGRA